MKKSVPATKRARPSRKRMPAGARREVIEQAAAEVFAERGYQGAAIDEIARRSGVSAPVVYDHFDSKQDLYRVLLERHFADLRQIWREKFSGDETPAERVGRSLEAWFAYVEGHPFAGRMLFRDTTGDPAIAAMHAEVAARSRDAVLPLLTAEPGAETLVGADAAEGLEMVWVVLRGVLQGLAIWWSENPQVPRDRVVATAMNALWLGFERVLGGEVWERQQK